MPMTHEAARKKHGIAEIGHLRKAFELFGNEKKYETFRKNGILAKDFFDSGSEVARLGHEIIKHVVPLEIRGDESPFSEERLERIDRMEELEEAWNNHLDAKGEAIMQDSELSEAVRKKLVHELEKEADGVDEAIEKMLQKRTEKIGSMIVEGFEDVLEELKLAPIKGANDPAAGHYAKRLYGADPHRFFELPELLKEAGEIYDDPELDEDELEVDQDAIEAFRGHTMMWNISKIIESERVHEFVEQERKKEMEHWGIRPFHEAKDIWIEVGENIQQHREKLSLKRIAEKEIEKRVNRKKRELVKDAVAKLEQLAEKDGMEIMMVENDWFKVPAEHAEKLKEELPPILYYSFRKGKKSGLIPYHA